MRWRHCGNDDPRHSDIQIGMINLKAMQLTHRVKKAGMRIHEKFKQRNQPRMARIYTDGESAGRRPEVRAGAAFSNPSTSKLARDCANTSPARSASGPSMALATRPSTPSETGLRLACQAGRCFGKEQPPACLRVALQNSSGIRGVNQPGSGKISLSVPIRVIRG